MITCVRTSRLSVALYSVVRSKSRLRRNELYASNSTSSACYLAKFGVGVCVLRKGVSSLSYVTRVCVVGIGKAVYRVLCYVDFVLRLEGFVRGLCGAIYKYFYGRSRGGRRDCRIRKRRGLGYMSGSAYRLANFRTARGGASSTGYGGSGSCDVRSGRRGQ